MDMLIVLSMRMKVIVENYVVIPLCRRFVVRQMTNASRRMTYVIMLRIVHMEKMKMILSVDIFVNGQV